MTGERKTVFIVDDDLDIGKLLTTLLGTRYDVQYASDPLAALTILEEATSVPDLFLFDVRMPSLDGLALAGRVKAIARFADVPLVFLTTQAETKDMMLAAKIGARDYVTKPFKPGDLLAKVAKVLR
jgi:DNA-binding response OmpR family regulator